MLTHAYSDKQYASAINAEFRSGQLAGLYVDKREVKVSGLEGMSRAELEKKLGEFRTRSMDSMPKRSKLSQRQKNYLKSNNWTSFITVFNEVHNLI